MSRRTASARPRPPDDVFFPVVPMLDMAFQLLAFFILTFQAPSGETGLGLDLPVGPAALPRTAASGRPLSRDTPQRLVLRAEAGPGGSLARLRLGTRPVPDLPTLDRLLRQAAARQRPVRLTLQADDALRYESAAELLAICAAVEVDSVRIGNPPPAERAP